MNDRNDTNTNALHGSVMAGNIAIVKLFVENDALLTFHVANA